MIVVGLLVLALGAIHLIGLTSVALPGGAHGQSGRGFGAEGGGRHAALEVGAPARGAGRLGIAPDQRLEGVVASSAVVHVERHGREVEVNDADALDTIQSGADCPPGFGPTEAAHPHLPVPAAPVTIRLVLHGTHGDDDTIRDAVADLRDAGHDVEVRVTWERGDARRFAAEAVDADLVVAAGGDGTVREVAEGLTSGEGDTRAALAILPLGTANDFASAAGLPLDDPSAALRAAVEGRARTIDVVRCGDRAFVNMATGGFGARVTSETPEGLKRALGGLSYLVAGVGRISEIEAARGTLRGPDFEWSGAFLALAVGNGRQAGGGVVLFPEATVDDGRLDVRIVPEGDGAGHLLLEALVRDRRTVMDEASTAHTGAWVEIETEEPLQVNLDGEPVRGTSFRFEVEPGALRCVLPDDSPLLVDSGG